MGTRVHLAAYAGERPAGLASLDTALTALERTETQLSTWRDESAISALNRAPIGTPWLASPDVCRLLSTVFDWHGLTGGVFDPAIGALIGAWGIHHGGRWPEPEGIREAMRRSGLRHLDFDRDRCTIVRRADATLDVGAFGKGEGLDRAAAALAGTSWMIDLGGQVSVGLRDRAAPPWAVAVAHPIDREQPLLQLYLREGSLATSGRSERDVSAGGRGIGHILDPRTGSPALFNGSVTVWHESGLTADILSTALFVMGPDEGLLWAEANGLRAVYLIPDGLTVRTKATRGFDALLDRSLSAERSSPHGN
jgi:thiamine biosynthesis lipoprotein